jgi:two-component system chemotaxis response regulator CheY
MARVLIVDDEESIRFLIKDILTPQGHEFQLAAGGTEALDILRKKKIDLAIVDRNMPGMTGIDVVKLIRLDPKLTNVKILMCTGSSVTKEIDEAFNAGADDYILKPLSFPSLLGKVAKALASPPK